jgi:hypothetical protein
MKSGDVCYVGVMTGLQSEYSAIEIEGDGVLCCLRKKKVVPTRPAAHFRRLANRWLHPITAGFSSS